MNSELQNILIEVRQQLEMIYKERLINIILFGSQARGDAVSESDIDILVVLQGSVKPGQEIARVGEITSMLSLKYNVVISCVFVSSDRYETERSPFLLNVHREGISA
jgi:predicted nucleotidyltransferase